MLPGFKFLLGTGMVIGSGIAESNKATPGQVTAEEQKLIDIYRDIRNNVPVYSAKSGWRGDWYAPKIWPKYIYTDDYVPTSWINLAHYYGTSVVSLQREYFQWYCKENNIRYDDKLFDHAYLRAHNPAKAGYDNRVQEKWSYDVAKDKRLRAAEEAKKKEQEDKKRAAEATQAEIDAEIIKKRIAVREARLAREAIEEQARLQYEKETPKWKRMLTSGLLSFQKHQEERKYHRP